MGLILTLVWLATVLRQMLKVMVQVFEIWKQSLSLAVATMLPRTSEKQSMDEGLVVLVDLVDHAETALGTVSQHHIWKASVAE